MDQHAWKRCRRTRAGHAAPTLHKRFRERAAPLRRIITFACEPSVTFCAWIDRKSRKHRSPPFKDTVWSGLRNIYWLTLTLTWQPPFQAAQGDNLKYILTISIDWLELFLLVRTRAGSFNHEPFSVLGHAGFGREALGDFFDLRLEGLHENDQFSCLSLPNIESYSILCLGVFCAVLLGYVELWVMCTSGELSRKVAGRYYLMVALVML